MTEEVPADGGSFIEGIVGQPSFINPLIANGNEADYAAIRLVFANLTTLAASYTESSDGSSWTVIMKDGLSWDDGKPLTADDVIFTVETLQDANARSIQSSAWQGVISEKLNENEIRFTLKMPYAFFKSTIESLSVAPRHIFGGIPTANLRLSEYNLAPMGSGPYSFKKLNAERDGFISSIELARNSKYAGTPAHIPSFTLRFYRSEDELISAFDAKQVQGAGALTPAGAAKIRIGNTTLGIPLPRYYAVFMNQSTHAGLRSLAVRHALETAVPRSEIMKDVFLGNAAAVTGPVLPTMKGYESSPENVPEKDALKNATAILDADGWLKDPVDGVRTKTVGKERIRLQFALLVPDIPFLEKTAEKLKMAWAEIGVRADITTSDPAEIAQNAMRTRNYQMLLFGNILKGDPDIFPFWHSSQKFSPGLNLALYDNKKVDTLLLAMRAERDETKREGMLRDIQRTIRADAPVAFIMSPNYLYAVTTGLKGFSISGAVSPADRFIGAENWYLHTTRRFKTKELLK